MNTIKTRYEYRQEINKSIFIGISIPVLTKEDVIKELNAVKQKYPNATHYCYAYALGDKGDDLKFYDDGEPSNTAGIVIYNVIKNKELTNILIVVVRYFGGVLLGAGGLVRAYSSSASGAVIDSNITEVKYYTKLEFEFDYSFTTLILKLMQNYKQLSSSYLEKVTLSYEIEVSEVTPLKDRLISLTNGSIKFN